MRRSLLPILVLGLLLGGALAQDGPPTRPMLDYPTMTTWLPETPGVTAGAPGGFLNPAAWSTLAPHRQEFALWFDDRDLRDGPLDSWGFATSGWLGFAMNSQVLPGANGETYRVNDWQTGVSLGDRNSRLGAAYRWTTGDDDEVGREPAMVLGALGRPGPYTSLGAAHTRSLASAAHQTVFDLGIRPTGSDRLALFADYTLDEHQVWNDGRWGAGLSIQPVRGLHVGGAVRENTWSNELTWSLQVGVTLENVGLHGMPQYDSDNHHASTTYLIRSNSPHRNLVDHLPLPAIDQVPGYAPLNLENRYLTYQKFRYFDERRVAWLDLARYLDAVEADPQLAGIVLDLRDFQARPSLVWELRGRLQDLQSAGKEVVALINRVDMLRYYLASVADHIVMDPEGDLVLQGVATGRTYFSDMIDKLGLGFQELRYFKYKSAAEVGSRMTMSEGQREQSQRLVDVIYEELREQIASSRDLTIAQFDTLVNHTVSLTPRQALARGLVDAVGRRHDLSGWLRTERNGATLAGPDPSVSRRSFPETHWGEPPRIAVVYAVGGCDMDSGIKGRTTGRHLEKLARDPAVKAVVLRADSPGGDPLPSDLVAAGITRCREAGKPVIVSQGDLAASGGYWISMNGEEILTTPLTITGSIGVIAAWVHDAGAGEKLGINYDGVKRGEHADLLRLLRVPGLPLGVPQRALDERELDLVRTYILDSYDSFVAGVAASRDLDEAEVRKIAQGRVWMGGDAIEHGLCDRYGGLTAAIETARQRAGLSPDQEVAVTEYPPRPLFDLGPLLGGGLPGIVGLSLAQLGLPENAESNPLPWTTFDGGQDAAAGMLGEPADYARWFLETAAAAGGKPRVVLPPEDIPMGWARPD